MLYNVSYSETARVRREIPYLVRMEPGDLPRMVDSSSNLLKDFPPELRFAEVAPALMGQMVYDPEAEKGVGTARNGFYGVPLWLSTSALQGPAAAAHPDKVWLVSEDMSFSEAGIVGDHQFCARRKEGRIPAAAYMFMTRRVQLDRLRMGVDDSFDYDLDDPVQGVLRGFHDHDKRGLQSLVTRYGVRTQAFQDEKPGEAVREGLRLLFMDKSMVVLERDQKVRVDLSLMDFGVQSPHLLHMTEECSRH